MAITGVPLSTLAPWRLLNVSAQPALTPPEFYKGFAKTDQKMTLFEVKNVEITGASLSVFHKNGRFWHFSDETSKKSCRETATMAKTGLGVNTPGFTQKSLIFDDIFTKSGPRDAMGVKTRSQDSPCRQGCQNGHLASKLTESGGHSTGWSRYHKICQKHGQWNGQFCRQGYKIEPKQGDSGASRPVERAPGTPGSDTVSARRASLPQVRRPGVLVSPGL